MDHGIRRRIHDVLATPNTLDEYPVLRQQRFSFLNRLARGLSSRLNAESTQSADSNDAVRAYRTSGVHLI
jgi:hypothetical protein